MCYTLDMLLRNSICANRQSGKGSSTRFVGYDALGVPFFGVLVYVVPYEICHFVTRYVCFANVKKGAVALSDAHFFWGSEMSAEAVNSYTSAYLVR